MQPKCTKTGAIKGSPLQRRLDKGFNSSTLCGANFRTIASLCPRFGRLIKMKLPEEQASHNERGGRWLEHVQHRPAPVAREHVFHLSCSNRSKLLPSTQGASTRYRPGNVRLRPLHVTKHQGHVKIVDARRCACLTQPISPAVQWNRDVSEAQKDRGIDRYDAIGGTKLCRLHSCQSSVLAVPGLESVCMRHNASSDFMNSSSALSGRAASQSRTLLHSNLAWMRTVLQTDEFRCHFCPAEPSGKNARLVRDHHPMCNQKCYFFVPSIVHATVGFSKGH